MGYNGTIELIAGVKPANNGNFPMVNAKDVYVDDDTRLDAKLNGLVPYEYLRCLFDQAADLDENSDWSKLLPWSIKITPGKDLGQW